MLEIQMTEEEYVILKGLQSTVNELTTKLAETKPGGNEYGAMIEDRNKAIESLNKYWNGFLEREEAGIKIKKLAEEKKWDERRWVEYAMKLFSGVVTVGVSALYLYVDCTGVPNKLTQTLVSRRLTKDM